MSQSPDFNIPNGTGQAVRLDIQEAVLALASCSSGAQSGLGTTQPCQLFADTDNNLLKIRDTGGNAAAASATFHTIGPLNTANLGLLPKSGGTMTGTLQAAVGAASSPSLNFGSTTTGFYQDASNVVGFSGATNLSFKFSNNGIDFIGQRPARFYDSDSTHFVALKSPATVGSNKTYTLPATSSDGDLLTVDGSGNMSFTASLKVSSISNTSNANQSTADQIYEGRAKIWVNFNGTNTTMRDDFGVTSVGDHGVGIYQINFDSNFSNTNYCPTGFVHRNGSTGGRVLCHIDTFNQINVGSYRFSVSGTNNAQNVGLSNVDVTHCFIAIHGDQ
tara:strand:- start:271 stop:1266 length:996 start_codon:yes stop_codon:yes gene_type:complete